MTFVHAKNVVVSLDGDDLTPFTNKCDLDREADTHDTTCFGQDSKNYAGGLLDGKVQVEGTYASGASGPAAVIEPLIGTIVVLVYKPEGAGVGLPIKTVSVVVSKYKESSEVAGMIKWTAEMQCTGDIALTSG